MTSSTVRRFALTTSPREAEIRGKAPAQCAWLNVPLNYDDPQSATTTVAVLGFAARGASWGSLVFNPGGPGGTGGLGALGDVLRTAA